MVFNLIPTDPDEYKIYADYLEDQGAVLTSSVRKGILEFSLKPDSGFYLGCISGRDNLGDLCEYSSEVYRGLCFSRGVSRGIGGFN